MRAASRHVPAHLWADLAGGRIEGVRREQIESHAASCERCRTARERIERTVRAMEEVRAAEPPELGWDHIGARIYWVTSSERRAATRRGGASPVARRPLRWILGGAAAAAAVALALFWGLDRAPATRAPDRDGLRAEHARTQPQKQPASRDQPAAAAEALQGVVVFLQGPVEVDGAPLSIDEPLEPGAHVSTGSGRVAVQFGDASGFELGPETAADLRAFDDRNVEIAVDGTIDVDLAPRAPGQRFAVVAGDHTVLVRGTAFRVRNQRDELGVSCLRGKVVVTDGQSEYSVAAGERLLIDLTEVMKSHARPLSGHDLRELERTLVVPMLPAWMEPESLFNASATLAVDASADRTVRIDGVEVGRGSLSLRVMSGRHRLESGADRGRWVNLGGGSVVAADLAPEPPEPAERGGSASDRRLRRQQLERSLGASPRVQRCLSSLRKRGLVEGSFVVFDLGIDPDGTQSFLNLARSNVPPQVQRCLRDVVDAVAFPPGPRARLRYRLAF